MVSQWESALAADLVWMLVVMTACAKALRTAVHWADKWVCWMAVPLVGQRASM